MKIRHSVIGMLAVTSLWASGAVAAPAVLVESESITVGTPTAVISVNWDGDGTVQSAQFEITYDDAELTPVNVAASCIAPWFCSNNVDGIIQFVADQGSPLPDVLIANITFDTSAAAIDTYPLAVANELYANAVPAQVFPSGTTDGEIDVTAGPQPSFSSVPAPGVINLATVDEGGTAPTQNISISNNGSPGTTLTGTCAMGAGDAEITLTSDGTFSVSQGGTADVQTVSCSTAAEGSYSRTLTCPHNGSNGPDAEFTVNCTIDPPPAPEYSSNPAIGETLDFGGAPTEQGEPNPEDSLSISNIGDTGSQLDVTCTDSVDPDGVFTVSNGVINNLLPTGGSPTVTVSCDSTVQGSYTGTLSCAHNGETATNPATYLLECAIGPPGAAVYSSDPAPDSTINLTPTSVAEGTDVPTLPLVVSNVADPGDSDLEVQCALTGDAPPISVTTELDGVVFIAPGDSVEVSFDCDTTTTGSYTATYTCNYNTSPLVDAAVDQGQGPALPFSAVYTVECEVREPHAVVEPQPPSGTPQQALVQPGGSHTFEIDFNEIADEGVDATLETCSLDDGTNFTILSPVFPANIPAGGSVTVQAQGTDPGGVDEFSDTLRCIYSDSEHPYNGDNELGQEVVYPLTITVGGDATFRVTKEFTDGQNPTLVDVTISCFTGLPLIQSQTISATQDVNFIVTSFDSGELDCEITEDLTELVGYTPTYLPTGENVDSDGACNFYDVSGGSENFCHIVNDADPVEVVIEKVWVIDGVNGDQIDQTYKLTLYCDTEEPTTQESENFQIGGCQNGDLPSGSIGPGPSYGFCQEFYGNGSETFTAFVEPDYPTTNCWVEELVYDDSVEVHNGCENLVISAGQGASCVITNTVFFEGIPTLSQYGMAILALLMLGVGLVGFRRFA